MEMWKWPRIFFGMASTTQRGASTGSKTDPERNCPVSSAFVRHLSGVVRLLSGLSGECPALAGLWPGCGRSVSGFG
jgi:hypothetical protein